MYIEASDGREGDKARLETNRTTARSNACLSFWYHMFGSHMGHLRVKKVTDRLEEVIWSRNGKLTRVVNAVDWCPRPQLTGRTGIGQPLREIHHPHNIVLSR